MTTWGWRARSIGTWTIVAIVVAGAAALFVWSGVFMQGRRQSVVIHTQDLKVGDCLQQWLAGTAVPPTVMKTQCDNPHFGEVIAILSVPETQDYPGHEALKRYGDNCGRKLFDYAPDLPDGPIFQMLAGYPNADSWSDGSRSVVCVAQAKGERWSSIRA
jgi:hypothetical protein